MRYKNLILKHYGVQCKETGEDTIKDYLKFRLHDNQPDFCKSNCGCKHRSKMPGSRVQNTSKCTTSSCRQSM